MRMIAALAAALLGTSAFAAPTKPDQSIVENIQTILDMRKQAKDKADVAKRRKVFWADSRDRAYEAAGALRARWGSSYPKAVEITLAGFDDHLRFMAEPQNLWTLLRTSNLIERFNRELRRRLRPAGAMQSELEISKLVWSVSQAQESRWRRRSLNPKKDRVQVSVQECAVA